MLMMLSGNPANPKEVYEEEFERPFLEETAEFYKVWPIYLMRIRFYVLSFARLKVRIF